MAGSSGKKNSGCCCCSAAKQIPHASEKNSAKWNVRYCIGIIFLAIIWYFVYSYILPVSNWFVFELLGLPPYSRLGTSLEFFIYDTVKILLLLVLLIYGIAWIRASLNVERLRNYLSGKRRGIGCFLGAVFGAVTPFCSCSSIPLFLGFTTARIPVGVTMSFLITSPLINEIAIVLLWGVLGWKFTVIYVVVGMLAGVCGGVFMDSIKAERWLQPFVLQSMNNTLIAPLESRNDGINKLTIRQRHIFAYGEMFSIFKRVWKWVIIGVGIGSALHGFVPQNWFAENLGAGEWWTVPAAVLVGIPLYSNVTGVVPVMESLLAKGLPVGTTLAFCMSAVAASIPEVMMLRQIMTIKLQALFIGYLWIVFTLAGWLFNILGPCII